MIVREKFHFIFPPSTAILPNEWLKERSNTTYPRKDVKRLALRRLLLGMVTGALP
jgi:hypothetical protein